MAPEVINKNYDARADIWSCGVILYILLCGYAPFNDQGTHKEIMDSVLNTEVKYPAEDWDKISGRGKDLVRNLLQKDPDDRISLADALHHPWITQNV